MQEYVVSIDVGGTFTDCVIIEESGRDTAAKARSTPSDNFKGGFFASIEAAAARLRIDPAEVMENAIRISHGSTVATNIMVQRSGARVGMITTKGHEDTLHLAKGMGRIHGEPAENLLHIAKGRKPVPLVPSDLIVGVAERVDTDGDVIIGLDEEGLWPRYVQNSASSCINSIFIGNSYSASSGISPSSGAGMASRSTM